MTDNIQVPGYQLIRKIGEGGMSTVYLALQKSLDREVALKLMSPALAANASFCEQFMKEGRIAAKLTHPHLMTVHDIGAENGVYYLASEYLPEGTLRERMQRLDISEILEIARDIASGLSYAHEKGFVHRDVKPGNIMFRSNGTAVLADFGIAKAMKSVSAATIAGNAIGTPDYMSPEQAQASPVDGRSDLYSLGAVMFECVAGQKPFRANDAYAVALMHVTEPVPKLPTEHAWLQPLIDGLMAKQPAQRFATGDAFIAACDKLVQGNSKAATSAKDQRSVRRRAISSGSVDATAISQRIVVSKPAHWSRLAGVGAGIALLVAIFAAGWYWAHRAPVASESNVTHTEEPAVQALPHPAPAPINNAAEQALASLDLRTLLSRAETYLAAAPGNGGDKLNFPPGDNAIDLFQEVLKRDPANAGARQGLSKISAFYAAGANSAYQRGLYAGADVMVDAGLRADPDNNGLLKLKTKLAKAGQGN